MLRKERGFTLIELLVVIAIIGILSSVVLASLAQSRAKARDARRASDLRQLQVALEFYYDANRRYPIMSADGCRPLADVAAMLAPYMSSVPIDPSGYTGCNGYQYWSPNGQNQGYSLYSFVETSNMRCRVTVDGIFWSGWTNVYCSDAF